MGLHRNIETAASILPGAVTGTVRSVWIKIPYCFFVGGSFYRRKLDNRAVAVDALAFTPLSREMKLDDTDTNKKWSRHYRALASFGRSWDIAATTEEARIIR